MLEIKDPAIKLFGWKIQLLADDEAPVIESVDLGGDTAVKLQGKAEQEEVIRKQTDATDSDNSPNQESIPDTNSDNPKTPSIDEEATKPNNSKTEKEQSDSNNSKETKTLKKPDKILPCPRCNSMETKFCYYNNYNVSQPRHFCKACQRYWTAGGSMRNVPVGAGRRKTKNSSSTTSLFHHQISIPEALQNGKKGQVLSFSTSLELDDAPISDSMASVLNLADKKNNNSNASNPCSKTRDDCSSVTDSIDEGVTKCAQEPPSSNELFPSQVPCIPWPYPWNSAGLTSGYCTPNIPVSFYPSGYWIPWFPQQPAASPTSLGKHSRECDVLEEPSPKQKAGNVLVPKTLRIDDPNEAAKSSIWATLGINNDSVNGGGLFKPFQSKSHEKNHLVESSPVLRANPAAFSRSLKFQESS